MRPDAGKPETAIYGTLGANAHLDLAAIQHEPATACLPAYLCLSVSECLSVRPSVCPFVCVYFLVKSACAVVLFPDIIGVQTEMVWLGPTP